MEILVGLVVLAGFAYLAVKRHSRTETEAKAPETTEVPYKVEVAPVIVTAAPPKAEAPVVETTVAEAPAEKPAKAKKPKAAAIKAKPKAEPVAKDSKPKAVKKPRTLKVVK